MGHSTEYIAETLRRARHRQGMSQRSLGELVGMPQAQISKIENDAVDARVSSLIALARGLGLELVLVPRNALPAVRSISRSFTRAADEPEPRPVYNLEAEDDGG